MPYTFASYIPYQTQKLHSTISFKHNMAPWCSLRSLPSTLPQSSVPYTSYQNTTKPIYPTHTWTLPQYYITYTYQHTTTILYILHNIKAHCHNPVILHIPVHYHNPLHPTHPNSKLPQSCTSYTSFQHTTTILYIIHIIPAHYHNPIHPTHHSSTLLQSCISYTS